MNQSNTEKAFSRQWIVQFRVSGILFALDVKDTTEILHMAELLTPPGIPSFLNGFINIEGKAIPVVDFSTLMGFPRQSVHRYTPLVIIGKADAPCALIVEEVLKVEALDNNRLNPLDDDSVFNQCVSMSGRNQNEEIFYILKPERILLAQEKIRMAEFQALAQKRLNKLQEKDDAHALQSRP